MTKKEGDDVNSTTSAISDFLNSQKKKKANCPKCQEPMETMGRTVAWCPNCRVNRVIPSE